MMQRYTQFSWQTNEELIRAVLHKPDATDMEYELAMRCAELVDMLAEAEAMNDELDDIMEVARMAVGKRA
jgi:hypothetical protein